MQIKHIILAIGFLLLLSGGLFFVLSDKQETETERQVTYDVPAFLLESFPNTDFSQANPIIKNIISGGPAKDGIPAIDNPVFEPVITFPYSDSVQAIVLQSGDEIKVYPYNILTWHEIVNDTVGDTAVSVTFCPLCGTAIVYNRSLNGGVTTFGVSGALIESNMVMYDRSTESLWQQSTGEALAGDKLGVALDLVPFQLLTMGEIKKKYPQARVLSEKTGHFRNYGRNPYSGYETDNNQFVFNISPFSDKYPAKEIMLVFRAGDRVVALPQHSISEENTQTVSVSEQNITIKKEFGEIIITTEANEILPFYFEMWFSFYLQHGEEALVF